MLQRLIIRDFIVIEQAAITLHEELNVLTGETGSGKSILIKALSFVLGEKAASSLIRQGAKKATVEVVFEKTAPRVQSLLEEGGIDIGEELIIRREYTIDGKNRLFINNQSSSLNFVKKLRPALILFCGQNSHIELFDVAMGAFFLDRFSQLEEVKKAFIESFQKEDLVQKKISLYESRDTLRRQERTGFLLQKEEIDSVNITPGEFETLYSTYTNILQEKESQESVNTLIEGLEESLQALSSQKTHFYRLAQKNPSFKEFEEQYLALGKELKDLIFSLEKRLCSKEDLSSLESIEARLSLLNTILKKYGNSTEVVLAYRDSLEEKLFLLDEEEVTLEELKRELPNLLEETNRWVHTLSEQRGIHAPLLAEKITEELRSLNMSHATLRIALEKKERSLQGDEQVLFFLQANLGEKEAPLHQVASGGELARVALALHIILNELFETELVLFDEIDANVGGTTARLIGEKLALLGKKQQLLAITHFPQMALHAATHHVVEKRVENERTYTSITHVQSLEEKEKELERMLGKKELV